MTIGAIMLLIAGVIVLIGGVALGIISMNDYGYGEGIGIIIVAIILSAALIIGPFVYMKTESGKRALKDQKSNFGKNDVVRTVTVYDINGKIIEQYTGKFDIETDREKYILFDDENGNRHIIYYTTSTVLVDEQ